VSSGRICSLEALVEGTCPEPVEGRIRKTRMKIIKITKKNTDSVVEKAIRVIGSGGVVVCPTDTIYGLIADAANRQAVGKIFRMKKRLLTKPLPIFVKDLKMAESLAEITERSKEILKNYWPGRVTVVLNRKGKKRIFGVDKKTIALRLPDYKLLNLILEKTNKPLAETSVNITNQPEINKIADIVSLYKNALDKPDLILDQGDIKKNLPSTVMDLTKKEIKILRKGVTIPIWTTKKLKK